MTDPITTQPDDTEPDPNADPGQLLPPDGQVVPGDDSEPGQPTDDSPSAGPPQDAEIPPEVAPSTAPDDVQDQPGDDHPVASSVPGLMKERAYDEDGVNRSTPYLASAPQQDVSA
jgi:hypothetical protein